MPDLARPGQIAIPFGGATTVTTHTSLSGAQAAIRSATSQAARMLVRYLDLGPLTDGDHARAMELPEGRISARRSKLIALGLVAFHDIVAGPHGAKCCRFELTVSGLHVAGRLKAEQTR